MSEIATRLAWAANFDAKELDCFSLFQIISGTVGLRRKKSKSDENGIPELRTNVYKPIKADSIVVKLSEDVQYCNRVPLTHPEAALLRPTVVVPRIEVQSLAGGAVFSSTRPSLLMVVNKEGMPECSVGEVLLDATSLGQLEADQEAYLGFLGQAAIAIGVDRI